MRGTDEAIQWRYVGSDEWHDLVEIDDIDVSVTVGTVTTLSSGSPATVTNSGTATDLVLDFGIPEGQLDAETLDTINDAVTAAQTAESNASAAQVAAEAARDDAEAFRDEAEGFAVGTISVATTRTALKGIDFSTTPVAFLREALREGIFEYDSTVLIATHQADETEYQYVAPNAGSNGAWVRRTGNSPEYVNTPAAVSLRPLVAGRQEKLRVLSELPDPADSRGMQCLLLAATGFVMAYCDGTDWWNLTAGSKIDPWWKPLWADGVFDPENGRYYWDSAVKALGDATDQGDGSYSIAWAAWWSGVAATVQIDYEIPDANTVSGTLFSWHRTTTDQFNVDFSSNSPRIYIQPPGSNIQGASQGVYPGNVAAAYSKGRRRYTISFANAGTPDFVLDNWAATSGASSAGTLDSAITEMRFGGRSRFDDSPLTNGTLHKVVWGGKRLSKFEMNIVAQSTPKWPIHMLGDSFLNLQLWRGQLVERLRAQGIYIPVSQDNLGSVGLSNHLARYALDTVTASSVDYDISKWKDATLIIGEMGWDDSISSSLESLKSLLGYIRHDRWLLMEPAPNLDDGAVGRSTFDELVYKLRDFCGGDYTNGTGHFVPTLAEALSRGDGSADDNSQIAKRRWPKSLTTSISDFHPSTLGHDMLGELVYDALDFKAWI